MKKVLFFCSYFIFTLFCYAGTNSDAAQEMIDGTIGAGVNFVHGKKYGAECSTDNKLACALSYLSYAQAASNLSAVVQAGKTKGATDIDVPAVPELDVPEIEVPEIDLPEITPPDVSDGGDASDRDPVLMDAIDEEIANLEDLGFKLDDKKKNFTLPDGNQYQMSDFSSAQAMADAGIIQDSEIDKVDSMIKKVNKQGIKKLKKLRSKYTSPSEVANLEEDNDKYMDVEKMFKDRPSRQISKVIETTGMIKVIGGEPVGVGSEDIFNMIRRRCKVHIQENKYITE